MLYRRAWLGGVGERVGRVGEWVDGRWPYYYVTYRFFWCASVRLAILFRPLVLQRTTISHGVPYICSFHTEDKLQAMRSLMIRTNHKAWVIDTRRFVPPAASARYARSQEYNINM